MKKDNGIVTDVTHPGTLAYRIRKKDNCIVTDVPHPGTLAYRITKKDNCIVTHVSVSTTHNRECIPKRWPDITRTDS